MDRGWIRCVMYGNQLHTKNGDIIYWEHGLEKTKGSRVGGGGGREDKGDEKIIKMHCVHAPAPIRNVNIVGYTHVLIKNKKILYRQKIKYKVA